MIISLQKCFGLINDFPTGYKAELIKSQKRFSLGNNGEVVQSQGDALSIRYIHATAKAKNKALCYIDEHDLTRAARKIRSEKKQELLGEGESGYYKYFCDLMRVATYGVVKISSKKFVNII